MNKAAIAVVVGLLIALGASGFLIFNRNQGTPSTPIIAPENGKSLMDLLSMGAQKCTVSDSTSDSSTNGTIYVASGKVRGDIQTQASGQTVSSHMIMANPNLYVWMDGQTTGFKIVIANQQTNAAGNSGPANSFDTQKKMNYQCQPWTADTSFFNLPSGVQFSDMSSLTAPAAPTPNSPAGQSYPSAAQCAACSSLTGDQKTQCLVALKCQ